MKIFLKQKEVKNQIKSNLLKNTKRLMKVSQLLNSHLIY